MPILEGLALYTELHYYEQPGERILPNPVPLHTQMVATARTMRDDQVLKLSREEACFESGQRVPGLLRLLFCDEKRPDLSFYLVGYLWVRAAAALIESRCPQLGRPPVMLPLLIKLLCDHPTIFETWKGNATEAEIVEALRQAVFSLSAEALGRVDTALNNPELAASFEVWRLHEFLAQPGRAHPGMVSEEDGRVFIGGDPTDDVITIRAAASVWISGSTSGHLTRLASEEDSSATLTLKSDPDDEGIEVYLPAIMTFWRTLSRWDHMGSYKAAVARLQENAEKYWDLVLKSLDQRRGRRLTVATYISFAAPTTFGVLVWDETRNGAKPFAIPYSPEWFESPLSIETTLQALRLPLSERREFASAIGLTGKAEHATDVSIAALLSDLISDEDRRGDLMQQRLDGLLDKKGKEQLRKWISLSSPVRWPWTLGAEAAEQIDRSIDLPGFRAAPDGNGLRMRDLLPVLCPWEPAA